MNKSINFKETLPKLSEEHIQQICRFTNIPYIKGDWHRWRAWAEFKKWHHTKLKERDELQKNRGGKDDNTSI